MARWHTKTGAKKQLTRQKTIYSGKMKYAEVPPRDFPWLDEAFYDEVSKKMADAGFRHVGDFECLTLSRQFPSMRTFLRCFVGDAGAIMAAGYHVKVRGLMSVLALLRVIPKNMRTVEFESEFDDRTFLSTNNCAGLNAFTDDPGITIEQLDPSTPLEQLLSRHRERLKRIVEERKVQPVRFATRDDVLAAQDRMHELRSGHRKRTGYVTRDQFEAMAGGKLSHAQREFVDEFEKARNDNQTA